jgi:hypothetical protein
MICISILLGAHAKLLIGIGIIVSVGLVVCAQAYLRLIMLDFAAPAIVSITQEFHPVSLSL